MLSLQQIPSASRAETVKEVVQAFRAQRSVRPSARGGDIKKDCVVVRHSLLVGDLGGARTLDPMIKSHLLYQLSYQVIFSAIEFFFQTSVCFSIAVAKVGFIFNLTNF